MSQTAVLDALLDGVKALNPSPLDTGQTESAPVIRRFTDLIPAEKSKAELKVAAQ
jgi:hypothetical protein